MTVFGIAIFILLAALAIVAARISDDLRLIRRHIEASSRRHRRDT